jgi:hypothetical protein
MICVGVQFCFENRPMGLIRKQFFIDPEQNRELKRLAYEAGMSEGEFIRESLSARIASAESTRQWSHGLSELSGAWAARDDAQAEALDLRRSWRRRLDRLGLSAKSGR